MSNALIPCTDELNRLKTFLAANAAGRALSRESRIMVAKYHDGLPPYSVEELQNTLYERSLEEALEQAL